MKFIFVDAENVGSKEIEKINPTISDKVMVFSRSAAVKEVCERKLFLYLSGYPVGSNQADFYIIGNAVGLVASLSESQREMSQFVLYSRDNSLVTAFRFQCQLHKVKYLIALEPKAIVQKSQPPVVSKIEKSLEQTVLSHFNSENTIEFIRKKLKRSKSEFTGVINNLIKAKKIKRVSKNKKTWVCTSSR
ncbi:hypothetical protein [Psychrobium sp. 1_MG-2023]|uniref:hypothetical protein n=1 Tax=Psychrobium sp. 1_MG-2023 TaxID=3062624 RepID=UPI000C32F29F|nr:hypothetical protein [Psychrobium sp. 1_MG-2023]MDP2561510.1 hypothetical protein [Psychrobium sp. 1_MG-2023]PKF57774.1 hypothetical protein CW748_06155 [Alteromonadales bacterium alter-6D02]